MWPLLYLPKGKARKENLDFWATDLAALLRDLNSQPFTGYVEILSPYEHALILFYGGQVYNSFYEGTQDLNLSREEILQHFLTQTKREHECVINVIEVLPQVFEGLSALESRAPLYRELETGFLDIPKLFGTLEAKRFTGALRFYHIRSHTRLGNILVKMNKITREQLQQAVRLQLSQKGALRLGDALVRIGAIGPKDLDSALDLQSHARKGSDIEIALAIFSQGKFFGGYSFLHKQLRQTQEEILPQMIGTEVLMDILEGILPEPIDLREVLKRAEDAVTAMAAAPAAAEPAAEKEVAGEAKAPPEPELAEIAADALNLKGDDLILDLSEDVNDLIGERASPPAAAPAAGEAVAAFVPETDPGESDETVRERAEEALPPAPAPEPEEPPVERTGLEAVQAVAVQYMGFLGKSLLRHESQLLGHPPGQDWNDQDLRELQQRFVQAASLLIGTRRARQMSDDLEFRLGREEVPWTRS